MSLGELYVTLQTISSQACEEVLPLLDLQETKLWLKQTESSLTCKVCSKHLFPDPWQTKKCSSLTIFWVPDALGSSTFPALPYIAHVACLAGLGPLHISSVAVFSSHHLVSPKFRGCYSTWTWTEPSTTASTRFSSETQTLPPCAKPQLPFRTSSILGFYYNGGFTCTNLLHPTSLQRSQDPKLLRLNSITPSCIQN